MFDSLYFKFFLFSSDDFRKRCGVSRGIKERVGTLRNRTASLQVSYAKKEEIEQKILEAYPKELEWIEISLQGTHYVVHVERRKN